MNEVDPAPDPPASPQEQPEPVKADAPQAPAVTIAAVANEASPSLAHVRASIDRVDDQMLALLGERMGLSASIASVKIGGGLAWRPARETQILRRLIVNAPEGVDQQTIHDVWRALLAASARRQQGMDIIVAELGDNGRLFDLARRHFGASARLARVDEPRAALARITDNPHTVAVLPTPAASGLGLWWPTLSETRFHAAKIMAALPHVANGQDEPEAVVVAANVQLEDAGEDTTLALAFDPHHRLQRAFNEAQMKGKELARARTLVLVSLQGFVTMDDPRLAVLARIGLDGFRIIGSYARI
jgi:chorismate mutase